MAPEEILSCFEAGQLAQVEGLDVAAVSITHAYLQVDSLVVMPLTHVSSWLSRENDIEIKDQFGQSLGTLCLTKDWTSDNFGELTIWRYAALLSESKVQDIQSQRYTFKSDYVIIESQHLDRYLSQYQSGSFLWGFFSHVIPAPTRTRLSVTALTAKSNIEAPTKYHKSTIQRFLYSHNNFEMFLKLYHVLELIFDHIVYMRISKLNDDLFGFSQIMKDAGRQEIDRLKFIVGAYCADQEAVAKCLCSASEHEETCQSMLLDYGKESNPIKDEQKWNKWWQLIRDNDLTVASLQREKLAQDKIILHVAVYWIYRIRCSIAHNRVGEFLLTDEHDKFISDFAIPLMLEIVEQVLQNDDFSKLNFVGWTYE